MLLDRLLRPRADSAISDLKNPTAWLIDATEGRPTAAGLAITPGKALTVAAVFACIRNLAEDIAKLPLIVYRRLDGGGKERAKGTPEYRILHDEANADMTPFTARLAIAACAVLYGNGYAEIQETGGLGMVEAYWPTPSSGVEVVRGDDQGLFYKIRGRDDVVPARRMIHIRGFTLDGILGQMVTRLGREGIALGLAAERFAAGFFGKGLRPSAVLEHPKALSQPAQDRLKAQLTAQLSGENQHSLLIAEEGGALKPWGVSPEEAQAVELRQFQIEDVARWFRMPPHKIGHLLRATGWSTLEATNLDYLTDTLMPWHVRFEQEFNRRIVQRRDPDLFCEHLVDALLRADTAARAAASQTEFMNGALTLDEWRARENRNPLPDGLGGRHFVPVNLQTIESATAPKPVSVPPPAAPPAPAPSPPAPGSAATAPFAEILADTLRRGVFARECRAAQRAAVKLADNPPAFAGWLDGFLSEQTAHVTADCSVAAGAAGAAEALPAAAAEYVETARAALLAALAQGAVARVTRGRADTEPARLAAVILSSPIEEVAADAA